MLCGMLRFPGSRLLPPLLLLLLLFTALLYSWRTGLDGPAVCVAHGPADDWLQQPDTAAIRSVPETDCGCLRNLTVSTAAAAEVTSSCAGTSRLRGLGQRVVAYSFYGNTSGPYFRGIEPNLAAMRRFYPGWVMRVYHNIPQTDRAGRQAVCRILCRYDEVDFCDVSLTPGHGDLSRRFGMVWRFLPLTDESVERFVSRDLDSLLSQRERDAVDEWIRCGKIVHVMRDHPYHRTEILGGMWGAWNGGLASRGRTGYRAVREQLLDDAAAGDGQTGWDQALLASRLYPVARWRADLLVHDSYLCRSYPLGQPFPSRRNNTGDFVGARTARVSNDTLPEPCPLACRPPQHTDWLWC